MMIIPLIEYQKLITEEITKSELDVIERYADKIFKSLEIDIEFSRHFIERLNDTRNKKAINVAELVRLFKKTRAQHGKAISGLSKGTQAVLNDIKTDVNMPFILKWDQRNKEFDLIAKTIMRKKDFKTSNKKFEIK